MIQLRKVIKGKSERLILVVNDSAINEVISYINQHAPDIKLVTPNTSGEFFIDTGDQALDREELNKLMRAATQNGLKLVGVRSYNPITKIEASSLGLQVMSTSLIGVKRDSPSDPFKAQRDTAPKPEGKSEVRGEGAVKTASELLHQLRDSSNVIFITRNLRSGTKVQHDGHVVIVGNVNPGAEVIATGNVIVLGTLRGLVHAGAKGDDSAFVYSSRFQASAVKIANKHIPVEGNISVECCLIRLEDGKASLRSLLR